MHEALVQFQSFLGECYRDCAWLLPSGLVANFLSQVQPPRHRAQYDNCPADSVSWYDAAAFCQWLSIRLNSPIRLPTEFGWQVAACGNDPTRVYPWGPNWNSQVEPWRANTSESCLGGMTAVGLYPPELQRQVH